MIQIKRNDEMQVFDIKAVPPSANNLHRNVRGKGRAKTERYKGWLNAAGWDVAIAKPKLMQFPVKVTILINRPNKRSDIDNRNKALIDLLVKHGVLMDDDQVESLHTEWSDAVDGCRVFVERFRKVAA
jgi:Holliday junction resolvase RusA-like endonuclease